MSELEPEPLLRILIYFTITALQTKTLTNYAKFVDVFIR